jgi:hypothetical protein
LFQCADAIIDLVNQIIDMPLGHIISVTTEINSSEAFPCSCERIVLLNQIALQ